jgi:hypothetical protein
MGDGALEMSVYANHSGMSFLGVVLVNRTQNTLKVSKGRLVATITFSYSL